MNNVFNNMVVKILGRVPFTANALPIRVPRLKSHNTPLGPPFLLRLISRVSYDYPSGISLAQTLSSHKSHTIHSICVRHCTIAISDSRWKL
jgi:hypothetical protein